MSDAEPWNASIWDGTANGALSDTVDVYSDGPGETTFSLADGPWNGRGCRTIPASARPQQFRLFRRAALSENVIDRNGHGRHVRTARLALVLHAG